MRLSDTYSGSIIHGFGGWFKQGEIRRLPVMVQPGQIFVMSIFIESSFL